MLRRRSDPRNQKKVLAMTATRRMLSRQRRPVSAKNSRGTFQSKRREGSAAGSRVIRKLMSRPRIVSVRKTTPDQTWRPRKYVARKPPASAAKMAERSVVSSMMPLPQLSFDSGSNSGSNPYFVGPKIAPCVQARNRAMPAISRRLLASAYVARPITPSSKNFVQSVTLRLLYLSAKYPPGMEKSRKGTAKSSGTTSTNQRSRRSFERAESRTRKLTSHLRALSLKAPWNWTAMSAQNPARRRGSAAGGASDSLAGGGIGGRSLSARRTTGKRSISATVAARLEC